MKRPSLLFITVLLFWGALAAAQGHTFLWWADGYRGRAPEGGRLLMVQTSRYGAAFDVERAALTRLGVLPSPASYAEAVAQPNDTVLGLAPASLRLSVVPDGVEYVCARAARKTDDHANYPVRLIEGGRFLQRFDLLGLEFEDAKGRRLQADGRLEVCAWPERMHLTLEVSGEDLQDGAVLRMELGGGESPLRAEQAAAGTGTPARVTLQWPGPAPEAPGAIVRATDPASPDRPLPVRQDPLLGALVVDLPERNWPMAENLDRLDRFPVVIENPGGAEAVVPVIFALEGSFQGITGMCPMLRDAEGNPSGIPVQISKNWHRDEKTRLLYEGAWFHAVTQVPVPPGGKWEGELAVAYARWGGVPAASHAQLCLIGWGGNQWWDQAAIGSFGESICYDPEVGLNRSMIDDVRPLMVTGMGGGQWQWTHNVGGGDFLVLVDAKGRRQHLTRVRTAYLSQGPNLTRVVYAGVSQDGDVAARIEVSTPRCDDVNRAYHRIRYDVLKPVAFSRLAFYQLGADHYNDHQFARIARGNADGLTEEWETERGGKKYLRGPMPAPGESPWIALTGGVRGDQWKEGAWADRGLVVRWWKARLGGQEVPGPFFAVYGTENGPHSANAELAPPPGLERLEPGDFVEADLELLVPPQSAADYYGPNAALRADLEANGGSWRVVHRLARANAPAIEMARGTLLRRMPVEIAVDAAQGAECTLRGGAGHVPVTFTGVSRPSRHRLSVDGVRVDQAVHGRDFWQVAPEDATGAFSVTYNIPLDGDGRGRRMVFQGESPGDSLDRGASGSLK
ncbi:MAG: hypothetical protein GXY15_05485 [Candidatus Hydrogenedentes bacterium]|nr:hypothetical protein [Candidatus Hydrogenedentota bacterium]